MSIKQSFRVFFVLIAAAMLLEIASSWLFFYTANTWDRNQAIATRNRFLNQDNGPPIREDQNRGWENSLILHPFWGYGFNPETQSINNFGFDTDADFGVFPDGYKIASSSESINLGLFGGSFAHQVGQHSNHLTSLLKKQTGRDFNLINLSIPGHALPQSLFAYLTFNELLDAVVFLDGFNEILNPLINNQSGCPPEFAKAPHYLYKTSLQSMSPLVFENSSKIIKWRQRMFSLTNWSLVPIIKHSLACHIIWKTITKTIQYKVAILSKEIEYSYALRDDFVDVAMEDIIEFGASRWLKYHRIVAITTENMATPCFHVLQPNPFVLGSKPNLTNYEARIVSSKLREELGQVVQIGYPILRSNLYELESEFTKAGQNQYFVDLCPIFKDNSEGIWIDGCHVNETGIQIVNEHLAQVIGNWFNGKGNFPRYIN